MRKSKALREVDFLINFLKSTALDERHLWWFTVDEKLRQPKFRRLTFNNERGEFDTASFEDFFNTIHRAVAEAVGYFYDVKKLCLTRKEISGVIKYILDDCYSQIPYKTEAS